jgi:hypothetical protein
MLGYSWVYAEADHKMRPSALSALASRDGAARGGKTGGAQRRAKAAATWQSEVKEKALELRAGTPGMSQAKLAEEIRYLLGDDELPCLENIVRYIRVLERSGELPKRRK